MLGRVGRGVSALQAGAASERCTTVVHNQERAWRQVQNGRKENADGEWVQGWNGKCCLLARLPGSRNMCKGRLALQVGRLAAEGGSERWYGRPYLGRRC